MGLIDDYLGITEANFRAKQMNSLFNLKTAEKSLQFAAHKCKTMFVGKNSQLDFSGDLFVDQWSTKCVENDYDDSYDLVEQFQGQVKMEKVNEWTYLGFVISNLGNNQPNIRKIKQKSIGIIKSIFHRIDSLYLKSYYFECGLLFKNVILRPSILYGSETYFNLTEIEVRQLERCEESYLRQLLKAPRSCPISQLYLDTGHYPARFEISKLRLLLLKYILNESENSTIYNVFSLQCQYPIRGDWPSMCKFSLKQLNINLSFDDIKVISIRKFKTLMKQNIKSEALKYLLKKQKYKGHEIEYTNLQTSDYLLPNKIITSIDDKRLIFSFRNKTYNLSEYPNVYKRQLCVCKTEENLAHIYECKYLNSNKISVNYNKIYNGTLIEQKVILNRMTENLKRREDFKQKQN